MTFEKTILIPQISSNNLSFYENREPEIVVENPNKAYRTDVPYGDYSGIYWEDKLPHEALSEVVSWGTKTLPGEGPFYFTNDAEGNPRLGLLRRMDTDFQDTQNDDNHD